MKKRLEGPLERKFWISLMALTFGPIVISVAVFFLGFLAGKGQGGFDATAPLFVFGFAMIGVTLALTSLVELARGEREWFTLIAGGAWAFFFGRAFLQMIGA